MKKYMSILLVALMILGVSLTGCKKKSDAKSGATGKHKDTTEVVETVDSAKVVTKGGCCKGFAKDSANAKECKKMMKEMNCDSTKMAECKKACETEGKCDSTKMAECKKALKKCCKEKAADTTAVEKTEDK